MATVDTWTGRLGTGRQETRRQGAGQQEHGAAVPRRRHAVTTVTPGERDRVLRQAKRHSVLVRILRVTLPVAAILSFGLYFTRARISVPLGPGTFSGEFPAFTGDNLKMDNPRYEGFTAEGGKFIVKAITGYQDFRNPNTIRLITIDSHLTQPNDQWAHLVSNEGIYDTKGELLKLSGDIKVTSSNGMTAYLKTADVQTKTQIVTSRDPVIVEMSNGTTVESDGMVLNAKTKEVTFEGQVRTHLVRPPASGKAALGKEAATIEQNEAPAEPSPSGARPVQGVQP
jgi:LPS export ABC transporter protein LptC